MCEFWMFRAGRSSIPLVQNQKRSLNQWVNEIQNHCADVALPLVNGRIIKRVTSPSHVGFLTIPYESIMYSNSFTMLLVRDFVESLQSLGSEDCSNFPSSLCPKLVAHTTKHIATSLPETSKESVTPFSDSSNRGRKTFGSSSGPKHKGVVHIGFTSRKSTTQVILWAWNCCQKSDRKNSGRNIGIALGGRIGNVSGV